MYPKIQKGKILFKTEKIRNTAIEFGSISVLRD
jgi:hypothetical protein